MNEKSIVKLQIVESIVKVLFILCLLLWMYQIYQSVLNYNDSLSAPWYINILYSTRLYVLFVSITAIIAIAIKHKRRQYTTKKLRFHIFDHFKKNPLLSMTILFISLILLLGIVIVSIQPFLLYHPNFSAYAHEQLVDLDVYESYEISDDQHTYQGFGKIDDTRKLPTILYFGGNGDSSAQAFFQYHISGFFDHFEDFQFIMIDYPDYGLSDGKARDKNILNMGDAVFQYVRDLDYVDEEQVYIYGYSIGTGVSTYLASRYEVKGLILIAPYSSITDLFNTYVPIFKGVFKHLIVEEFDSVEYAASVDVSPLIIASLNDKTIPYALSEKLANSFSTIYEFLVLNDTEHNEFLNQEQVIETIVLYINT